MEIYERALPKFEDLVRLRLFLGEIESRQLSSLSQYYDESIDGFYRYDYDKDDPQKRGTLSMSSTSTCVLSLTATGRWHEGPWRGAATNLAKDMLSREWTTSGLEPNNPYTVAFAYECVLHLLDTLSDDQRNDFLSDASHSSRISKAEAILSSSVANGAVALPGYPKSAYLTQLVVRVLLSCSHRRESVDLLAGSRNKIIEWSWQELNRQLALILSKSKSADTFQVSYCIILIVSLVETNSLTPDQSLILNAAIDQIFLAQNPDGTWPQSQPLFHDPKVGSAHCYEYEMLVQLLSQPLLTDRLLEYLPRLAVSAYGLRDSRFFLEHDGWGWTSGHHPQIVGAESWATASVHHYAHMLDRLVAEAFRQSIFSYLRAPYSKPLVPCKSEKDFAPKFWDCPIWVNGSKQSLRRVLLQNFVVPISEQAKQVKNGRRMPTDTPMAAIFFGPPGTSKTELTNQIASYLNWPRLTIDPSHFVRNGLDQIQAEADRIFTMLAEAEEIVVLLDEFDEMVRERQQANEMLSRFLTTSMLPKLAEISKKRKMVFIVATNYIDQFDTAIRRPGRFDMLIQVMPPSAYEKISKMSEKLQKTLISLGTSIRPENLSTTDDGIAKQINLSEKIESLTFDEYQSLLKDLEVSHDTAHVLALLEEAYSSCTLRSSWSDTENWGDVCKRQRARMRIPRLARLGMHVQLVLVEEGTAESSEEPKKVRKRRTRATKEVLTSVESQPMIENIS